MLNVFAGFEQSNRYSISKNYYLLLYNILIGLMIVLIGNEHEEILGYIAEEPKGLLSMFSRQLFRTHRPFRALVMDSAGSPILWVSCSGFSRMTSSSDSLPEIQLRRPFAWINSRMFVQRLRNYREYDISGEPVLDTFAEVQQRWHLWRRRYDLFLRSVLTIPISIPGSRLSPTLRRLLFH